MLKKVGADNMKEYFELDVTVVKINEEESLYNVNRTLHLIKWSTKDEFNDYIIRSCTKEATFLDLEPKVKDYFQKHGTSYPYYENRKLLELEVTEKVINSIKELDLFEWNTESLENKTMM